MKPVTSPSATALLLADIDGAIAEIRRDARARTASAAQRTLESAFPGLPRTSLTYEGCNLGDACDCGTGRLAPDGRSYAYVLPEDRPLYAPELLSPEIVGRAS